MILALDTAASRSGWCLGAASGPVETGSASFGGHGDNIGALLAMFRDWLKAKILADSPSMVAFEKPVRPFREANLTTFRQLYGIAGMVELVCRDLGVPVYEADNKKCKKLFYGFGDRKPTLTHALRAARYWGIEAENSDEADAAAVFMLTVKMAHPTAFERWEREHSQRLVDDGERLL